MGRAAGGIAVVPLFAPKKTRVTDLYMNGATVARRKTGGNLDRARRRDGGAALWLRARAYVVCAMNIFDLSISVFAPGDWFHLARAGAGIYRGPLVRFCCFATTGRRPQPLGERLAARCWRISPVLRCGTVARRCIFAAIIFSHLQVRITRRLLGRKTLLARGDGQRNNGGRDALAVCVRAWRALLPRLPSAGKPSTLPTDCWRDANHSRSAGSTPL